jgi:plasmid replication initiation protein
MSGQSSRFCGPQDIKDNSGRVLQDAPLELWANLKQRALDVALKEINKHSDIQLELEFVGRGAHRKVQSLGFRISLREKMPEARERLESRSVSSGASSGVH